MENNFELNFAVGTFGAVYILNSTMSIILDPIKRPKFRVFMENIIPSVIQLGIIEAGVYAYKRLTPMTPDKVEAKAD